MIDKILEKYEKRVEYFAENPVNQEFSIRERLGEIDIMKEFLGAILISKQFRDYQILSASQTLYEAEEEEYNLRIALARIANKKFHDEVLIEK